MTGDSLERRLRLPYRDAQTLIRGMANAMFHEARDDVEDAVQCVWTRVLEAIKRDLGPTRNPRGWLRSTTHHTLVNYLRRTKDALARREYLDSLDEIGEQNHDVSLHAVALDPLQLSRVSEFLGICSSRQRFIIRLRLQGESGSSIARFLGVSPALVSREMSRIHKVLRIEL